MQNTPVSDGYNPNRDEYLFWYTSEGYVIAQDIDCMNEYVQMLTCGQCEGDLIIVARLNRDGQGLKEFVCVCRNCRQNYNIIFDISNDVFQQWWAEQLGELYIKTYDDSPRQPDHPPEWTE